jgi:hypothetical protein
MPVTCIRYVDPGMAAWWMQCSQPALTGVRLQKTSIRQFLPRPNLVEESSIVVSCSPSHLYRLGLNHG